MKVCLTFTEGLLGTASANPEIHREFIAAQAPDAKSREEEVAAIGVDGAIEKSMTVFPRNSEGKPIMWDYQIKGFFKDACGMLTRVGGRKKVKNKDGKLEACKEKAQNESRKLESYKKVIDGLVFVKPRQIDITVNGEIGHCQRPLRGQTSQGERIALANSEEIPAGSSIIFEVVCLDNKHEKLIREWLNYGQLRGLGQWRNSGKGRFDWKEAQ